MLEEYKSLGRFIYLMENKTKEMNKPGYTDDDLLEATYRKEEIYNIIANQQQREA